MINKDLHKLLIIDDDPDILTIAKYALKKEAKLEVRSANSGEEGLLVAKSFIPDLILLDVMMPHMDGITTLKNLRLSHETQHIPVAFFTAKVTKEEIDSYAHEGVIDVVIKPFDPLKFLETITQIWHKYLLSTT